MATQPQVSSGGASRQRALVLALAGVAVIALAALVARPLLLGGSRAVAPTAAAPSGAAAPTRTSLIGPSTTIGTPAERSAGTAKDPFRPLVAAGGAAPSGLAAGAGATTATTLPTQTTVPGAGAGTASTPGGGSTAGQKVTLLDVFSSSGTRYVKVTVDGAAYTVKEGQTFASSYRVVDIGTACATFESGTTPFTLCEGEAVLK